MRKAEQIRSKHFDNEMFKAAKIGVHYIMNYTYRSNVGNLEP